MLVLEDARANEFFVDRLQGQNNMKLVKSIYIHTISILYPNIEQLTLIISLVKFGTQFSLIGCYVLILLNKQSIENRPYA